MKMAKASERDMEQNTTKERPILFSGAMVRAILSGQKTQTRRVVKGMALEWLQPGMFTPEFVADSENDMCPYGKPGDRLFVREAFSYTHGCNVQDVGSPVWCWADGNPGYGDWSKPKPSIHMPRWACRIVLEIVSVRVERLQDISEDDARAEGLKGLSKDGTLVKYGIPDRDGLPGNDDDGWQWAAWEADPRRAFRRLWEHINGVESWAANPWCWVVEFRKAPE